MLIDLAIAKQHLRVDGVDDDAMITLYLGAAEKHASDYLGRTIYADETEQGTDTAGIIINDAIKAAVLLTLGHLYANREDVVSGVSVSQLPNGADRLLQPYRAGLGL